MSRAYLLGECSAVDGVDTSNDLAEEYALKAVSWAQANEHSKYGLYALGYLYENKYMADESVNFLQYYLKSAEQGDVFAQIALGDYYSNRVDVTLDNFEKAFYWYKPALKLGNSIAEYSFGRCSAMFFGASLVQSSAEKGFRLAVEEIDYLPQWCIL